MLSLVFSAALPLLTGVVALLWAGWVAPEREPAPDLPAAPGGSGEGGRGR